MSSNKRASKHAVGSKGSKKNKQLQSTLFSDGDEILKGLNEADKGKCLLIPSYPRAGLHNNSGECHQNLMAFGGAISPIQAIDG